MVKTTKVKSCVNLKSIYMGGSMLRYPLLYILRGEVSNHDITPLTVFNGGMMGQSTTAVVKGE